MKFRNKKAVSAYESAKKAPAVLDAMNGIDEAPTQLIFTAAMTAIQYGVETEKWQTVCEGLVLLESIESRLLEWDLRK